MVQSRKEYQRDYRKKHPRTKYFSDLYQEQKKERLTYQRNYDIINKEAIVNKRRVQTMHQHITGVSKCTTKWAIKWKVAYESFAKLLGWSYNDPVYVQLYNTWKDSGYEPLLRPVVMRGVKKNGFVQENLHWDIRKNFSWWNEDAQIYAEVEKETEDQQRVRNQSTRDWRKKVRQDFKNKQKARRGRV